ncbi:biotin synthase [Buchnera aphidicola str. Bp (Baizongia pistaciae)]|uniref:Biotin synthase n=1 Tax=Buchnera aphidicola subsp. Baizongia pistaciae (strain Bp) TaxID=224915 RepID=BIOB_BUCBP|nr:biotin synthase BioB [Buchnera aphidicola]Q89AK5.1 RecName: Full=Biotin synthase [Buchnera aphidicola str. Bp (Baizongia pistaciae)]AAO26997.1 biotin synthase [Buchnera aphidicola str. Bp (Baizongia pistaciae)]
MKTQWNFEKVKELFDQPFFDILFLAQNIHRKNFNANQIQISTLLSIKTGACPEDCKYCPQSARYKTNIKIEKLLTLKQILKSAQQAKKLGSTRFCMGAAWKNPKERDMHFLKTVIQEVKKLGLETCMTLGTLHNDQADRLAKAGLDFYNHNLDTSKSYYQKIVTTRTYQDRLNTLKKVRKSGMKICSGGILGLGEKLKDRIELLIELSNLEIAPESIPINMLVKVKGTPLENQTSIDTFDFIKTIAITRIMMPTSYIRLSAGRENMNEQTQAMCFLSGANSIFYGCKLLTTPNPKKERDKQLFSKLGLNIKHKNTNLNYSILSDNSLNYTSKIHSQQFYNAETA